MTKDFLRSATIQGYATSINSLFRLQSMEAPVDTSDPNNMAGILINNLVKEEDIARQSIPLDSYIFAELLWKSNISCSPNSEQCTLFDLVALGRYIGPCVSKYAQTTDKNVDYHVYPSGKQVIKAFTANYFQFFDKNSQVITELSDTSIEVVNRVRITWHIQKNTQNNQTVTLLSDKTNIATWPILAALHLVLRARRLSQPDSMSVACYLKKDALAYTSLAPGLSFSSEPRQEPCVLIYPKRRSSDILPTRCESGLVSFLTRQENCLITSRNAFVGWAIPFGCTCVICTSSRTSTARPFEHCLKRSWI